MSVTYFVLPLEFPHEGPGGVIKDEHDMQNTFQDFQLALGGVDDTEQCPPNHPHGLDFLAFCSRNKSSCSSGASASSARSFCLA